MAFSKIYSDIPKVDTAALVELIKSPQKAAELWGKYEEARAAYEAQRAAIAAEGAELKKKQVEFLDQLGSFTKDTEDFTRAKAQWEAQVKQDKLSNQEWQKQLDAKEKSNALTAQGHSDAYKEIQRQRLNLDSREAGLDELQSNLNRNYNEKVVQLEAREAAVAAREAKAVELAKLLKEV
jgi:hypothetical protein